MPVLVGEKFTLQDVLAEQIFERLADLFFVTLLIEPKDRRDCVAGPLRGLHTVAPIIAVCLIAG
jgi:hypothetical protein